eukprot:221900-Pyramimonas_sp.AAC.1
MPRLYAQDKPGARGTLECAAYPSLRAMRQWRPACLPPPPPWVGLGRLTTPAMPRLYAQEAPWARGTLWCA